jgi:hypothetical protein
MSYREMEICMLSELTTTVEFKNFRIYILFPDFLPVKIDLA